MRDRFLPMLLLAAPLLASCSGASALRAGKAVERDAPPPTIAAPSRESARELLRSGSASTRYSVEMVDCSNNYRRATAYELSGMESGSHWILIKDHLEKIEGVDAGHCPARWPEAAEAAMQGARSD